MDSMVKKIILGGLLVIAFFLSTTQPALAVGCCVYYDGAPGSAPICSAVNPDSGSVFTFADDGAGSFACISYHKDGKAFDCANGYLDSSTGVTECLDAEYTVVSHDLVGAYLYSSKTTVQGKTKEMPNNCLPVTGYTVQTKSETDVACKIGRSFLATQEGKGTFNSENFKNALTIALDEVVGDISDFFFLLQETSVKYCCIPKTPLSNGCQAPGHKTQTQFTLAQAKEGLKPGADLLPYFFCQNNQVLYPVRCNDGTTQISKPSEEYKTPSLAPTAIQYCQAGFNQQICICNGKTGECDKYASQSATLVEEVLVCKDKAQGLFGKFGYCKSEPIGKTVICENDPPESVEYEGADFVIPDATGLNQIGTVDPKELIARIIKGLLGLIGSLSLVMFIYGGILLMSDRGSAEQASRAKEILVWTSLGLAVIFAAYAIVDFIFEAFPK